MMGRFLGIAWETGDQFTFKVWSEPNGDYSQGREFIRNVVRARHESEVTDNSLQTTDTSQFKFQKKVKTRKRKRTVVASFELKDIPELGDDELTSEDSSYSNVVGCHQNPLDSSSRVQPQEVVLNDRPVIPGETRK